MLPALATVEMLNGRLSEPAEGDDDLSRAQAALEDASTLIRSETATTWVTDGALDDDVPDVVVMVTLAVARRAYLNPDGIRQETLADHSVTYGGTGAVYLTGAERALVRKAVGLGGIGTISTTRGPLETSCAADDLFPEEQLETMPWST